MRLARLKPIDALFIAEPPMLHKVEIYRWEKVWLWRQRTPVRSPAQTLGEEETLQGRVGSSRHALCVCLGVTQTGFRGNQWSFFGENLLKFLVFDLRQNFSKMNFKALRLAWVTVQDQSSPRQAKLLTGEFRRKYR